MPARCVGNTNSVRAPRASMRRGRRARHVRWRRSATQARSLPRPAARPGPTAVTARARVCSTATTVEACPSSAPGTASVACACRSAAAPGRASRRAERTMCAKHRAAQALRASACLAASRSRVFPAPASRRVPAVEVALTPGFSWVTQNRRGCSTKSVRALAVGLMGRRGRRAERPARRRRSTGWGQVRLGGA